MLKKYSFFFLVFFLINIYFNFSAYQNFQKKLFDLGYNSNLIFNTLKGNVYYTSFYKWNMLPDIKYNSLGDHLFWFIPFFSPVFLLYNSPFVINLLNIFLISITGIYILKILKIYFKSELLSLIILCSLFFFNNQIMYLSFYDFHFEILTLLFISIYFFYLLKNRYKISFIFGLLLLLIKETLIPTFSLLFFLTFIKTQKKKFIILTLISVVYFFVAINYILPYFRKDNKTIIKPEYFQRYSSILESPNQNIFSALLKNPKKIKKVLFSKPQKEYFKQIYSNYLYLPLLSIYSYSVIPSLLKNSLSNLWCQKTIYFQYNFDVTILFIITTILFLKFIYRKLKLIFLIVIIFLFFSNIINFIKDNPYKQFKNNVNFFQLKNISENNSIAVDDKTGVFFANRKKIKYLDFEKKYISKEAYIYFFYDNKKIDLKKLLQNPDYKISSKINNLFLLEKKFLDKD